MSESKGTYDKDRYIKNRDRIIEKNLAYYYANKEKIKEKYDYKKISEYNRSYYLNVTKPKKESKARKLDKIFYPNHKVKPIKQKVVYKKIRCDVCHIWMNEINYDKHKNTSRCIPVKSKPNQRYKSPDRGVYDCGLCKKNNMSLSEYTIHCNQKRHIRKSETVEFKAESISIKFD